MINRRFTFQDNLFLAVVTMLLIAGFCYLFAGKPLYGRIREVRREMAEVEDELEIQRYMAKRKENMIREMEEEAEKGNGKPASYGNLIGEMDELGVILSEARAYDISISREEVSGDTVRREIAVSYQADSYRQARKILEAIENGTYCCLVKDADFVRKTESGIIYGSLLVTYYEPAVTDGQGKTQDDEKGNTGEGS